MEVSVRRVFTCIGRCVLSPPAIPTPPTVVIYLECTTVYFISFPCVGVHQLTSDWDLLALSKIL